MKRTYLLSALCGSLLSLFYSPLAMAQTVMQPGNCGPSSAYGKLDINNVKATISNTGNLFFGQNGCEGFSQGYEVPKNSGKGSIYAAALWLGAIDEDSIVRVAALRFRGEGDDFYAGPLDSAGNTESTVCDPYNRLFKINRWQVEDFMANRLKPGYKIPEVILNWPHIAPYHDVNADGHYNAADGDYPEFDFENKLDNSQKLLGDQCIWWVMNDNGNIHTETRGLPLGVEVHVQAFAYGSSAEAINNTTFYHYKIINKGGHTLKDMHAGFWVDTDLGDALDDYVACDVSRGMGYTYNGKDVDGSGGALHYGAYPPAIGSDFVYGPKADADNTDNQVGIGQGESINGQGYGDGIKDNERLGLMGFIYPYSSSGGTGDPINASHYYNYLRMIWKDNTPLLYGGSGHANGGGDINIPARYMFPGDSDTLGFGTNGIPQISWSEEAVGNVPGDRRFFNSTGPFTMKPDSVQDFITAITWSRDTSASDTTRSRNKLRADNDYIQAFADSSFKVPCAMPYPDYVYEQDVKQKGNFTEWSTIVNFAYPYNATSYKWNFGDGKTSTDKAVTHDFKSSGLYNVCLIVTTGCGTDTICKYVKVYKLEEYDAPEITRIEGQGNGLGYLDLAEESIDSILSSPQHRVFHPKYKANMGPVHVSMYDTSKKAEGDYLIMFDSVTPDAGWKIVREGTTDTVYSDHSISAGIPQYISEWGLQVTIKQYAGPGSNDSVPGNGFLGANLSYADPSKKWFSGVPDTDTHGPQNWIRSGCAQSAIEPDDEDVYILLGGPNQRKDFLDPGEDFENILGGIIAPYKLTSRFENGPAINNQVINNINKFENVRSVQIVMTPDKSKWSRCPVIEMGEDDLQNEGKAKKFQLRRARSIDQDGNALSAPLPGDTLLNGTPVDSSYGWFPGYAIDLSTGTRLNVAYSEDSWLAGENGRDMKFNPTSTVYDNNGNAIFGGKHYLYIYNHNTLTSAGTFPAYDGGVYLRTQLKSSIISPISTRQAYSHVIWTAIPLAIDTVPWLSTEATIKLHVGSPYKANLWTDSSGIVDAPQNRNMPMYRFTIDEHIGIEEKQEEVINVFPNPFSHTATLRVEAKEKLLSVAVFDLAGRQMTVNVSLSGNTARIEKGNLTPGVYLYDLRSVSGKRWVGKLMAN